MIAGAAETRPTLLAIDDLHWCDVASLEFVLYVLHRLDELPVALVKTRRPTPVGESSDTLDRIASHPRVRLESLFVGRPLTPIHPARPMGLAARACRLHEWWTRDS